MLFNLLDFTTRKQAVNKNHLLLNMLGWWAELRVFLPEKCTFTLSDVDQSFFFRSLRVGVMSSRLLNIQIANNFLLINFEETMKENTVVLHQKSEILIKAFMRLN